MLKLLRKKKAKAAPLPRTSDVLKTAIGELYAVEFYDEKTGDEPRFLYRRLLSDLKSADASQRAGVIDAFLQRVEEEGGKGDFIKFKWCLPDFLTGVLHPEERARIEEVFAARRAKRNKRYLEIYPHCTDEFSVGQEFLNAVLDTPAEPIITKETKVFTIGSCFARNIAVFLKANNYDAESFVQAEDLNSPLSNAKMLAVATAPAAQREAYLTRWVTALYEGDLKRSVGRTVEKEIERLESLMASLRSAEVLILTIGNTLDFFIAPRPEDVAPQISVAPKFLRVSDHEDINRRNAVASRLKQLNAAFRLADYQEAKEAIRVFYQAVRTINPSAKCLITLSPVPIDSAIGVRGALPYGAVELDCISKSTLRTALFELFNEWSAQGEQVRYFPSYEIVRWIGAMLSKPAFGAEDAASRHVSSKTLSAVYAFFLSRFGA